MAELHPLPIPNGLEFSRKSRYTKLSSRLWLDVAHPDFYKLDWHGQNDDLKNDECPIFLYQSKQYLQGQGDNLQVVQHNVIATVFQDRHADLKELDHPSEYPIIPFFWHTNPDVVEMVGCDYEPRDHPTGIFHCTTCTSPYVGFNDTLTDLMHESVSWPFPQQSILAQRTSIVDIAHLNTQKLTLLLGDLKIHMEVAESLLDKQDVDRHINAARSKIESLAVSAKESYQQLTSIRLDKSSIEFYTKAISDRINFTDTDAQIARLRLEAKTIEAKIEALSALL